MGFDMLEGIDKAVDMAKINDDVKAILFQGAGERAFSTGANIKEFEKLKDGEVKRWIEFGNDINNKIETLSKPTVAYINGYAMGGGLELALACDFRLVSDTAILASPEVSNGWLPGWGGMTRLRRLVGEAHSKRIILFGEKLDANEALRIGLITKIVQRNEVQEFLNKLMRMKPIAYALAKSAIMDSTRTTLGTDVDFDVLAVKISHDKE
ncbi:enoyl-CoA hydratase [Jejuia pallidilutea]|nr:enoyl-CoA hydratase [Jejuia pallidilutea]